MHIATHTFAAYCNSKGITPLEGFRECFAGFTYGKENHQILPSDQKRIMQDLDVWKRKAIIPTYVLKYLETVRRRQMQEHMRSTYSSEPLFI